MPLRPATVSKPLNIYEIAFDRAAIDGMPADARRNLFRFGHIANEINSLSRLITFSFKPQPDPIRGMFSDMRAGSLLRLLIGMTFEGYQAVERSILKSPFGRTYTPKLLPEGQDALKRVKSQLGNMQLMAALRNGYSFHIPSDSELDLGYTAIPSAQGIGVYSGERRHASFYQMSHSLLIGGMNALVPWSEFMTAHEAMAAIVDDTMGKVGALSDFIEQLIITLVEEHSLAPNSGREVAQVDGIESMLTFQIPPLMRD